MSEDKEPQSTIIPLVEEVVRLEKQSRTGGGVRINTGTITEEHLVDEPVSRDEVTVRRVSVQRFVQTAEPDRFTDDTQVVSLHREVLHVVRRLQVYEEIHITRRSHVERHQEVVTLRRQTATVERIDDPDRS